MTILIIVGLVLIAAAVFLGLIVPRFSTNPDKKPVNMKTFILLLVVGLFVVFMNRLFFYAEPGMSYLVQYPWGTQRAALRPGFQPRFFGDLIEFKKVLTVKFAALKNRQEGVFTSHEDPIQIRFNDAVSADVEIAVRFRLPITAGEFIKVAVDFRDMNNLVNSALIPIAREAVRNSARMISAQEYIIGKGGEFENAILDQLEEGIYRLKTTELGDTRPEEFLSDDRTIERSEIIKYQVEIQTDSEGNYMRKKHPLLEYGITVSQATVENVDPEPKFKETLSLQRDAAAQANVERQQAKKAEYEKQRIIAEGEAEKAQIRVNQEKEQIQTIIAMETKRKEQEEAVKMRELELDAKRLEAQGIKAIADAEAYQRRALYQADGALSKRLEAYQAVNAKYAEALKDKQLVPQIVIGGDESGNTNSAMDLLNLFMAKTARDLSVEIGAEK